MRRTLRYLRIAVTALSLTACVLLVVLWMRSYTWCDIFCLRIDGTHDQWLQSLDGKLTYDGRGPVAANKRFRWIVHLAEKQRLPEDFATKPILGFQWSRGGYPRPMIPHWFPAFIFAALAALPWLHWRRFSLRTLLAFMTLAAMLMGAIAYFLSMAPEPEFQTDSIALPMETETGEEDLFGGDLFEDTPSEEDPFAPF
ncbi:MAG TPA: hypothetical protein VHK01_21000 [Lacipirellulaceae bacterium]|jgi:hypothetical protein|nr:hypothetical protein [Lacipirellulaceae bacterium]